SSGSSGAKSAPDATTRTGQSPHGQTSAPPPGDEPNHGRGLNELLTSSGAREDAVEQLVREYKHVAKNGNQTEPARAFVQRHAAAASQAYAEGREELSKAVREQLLRVFVSFDTDIVIPAFVTAIEHYAQTGNG